MTKITNLGLSALIGSLAVAAPGFAEVYGGVGLSVSNVKVNDTGTDEGDATHSEYSGFGGYRFSNGVFVEADLLFSRRGGESDEDSNNGLRSGDQFGLRFGHTTGALTYEAFGLIYDHENGDSEDDDEGATRGYGYGIGLSYQASETVTLGAMLGGLELESGERSDGGEGEDSLDSAVMVSFQGDFQIRPRFGATLRTDYVDGTVGDDDADEKLDGYVVRLTGTYAATDRLDVFAFAQMENWDQPQESDDFRERSVGLGVSYNFGPEAGRASSRMDLPNAAQWSANVAGHLE